MVLSIELHATPCKRDPNIVSNALEHLVGQGYEPLIFEAKSKFLAVVGISRTDVPPSDRERLAYEHYHLLRTSRAYFERERYRVPIAEDLFCSKDGTGILVLALIITETTETRRRTKEEREEARLEIGFVGRNLDRNELLGFTTVVSESLKNQGLDPS